jgi:hypothetical protein
VKTYALLGLLAMCPLVAGAQSARAEGVVLRIEPGYAYWNLDGPKIAGQAASSLGGFAGDDVRFFLVDQTPNAPAVALLLGYNILGHVTLAAELTATGWDVSNRERGGAGFLAGTLAWHPAELFAQLKERPWDAQLYFGAGYGVMGEQRALDGLHYELGLRAEYFLSRSFSIGAALRYLPLSFGRYALDWNGDVFIPLPQGSGGSLFVPSLTLAVHAPVAG